MNRLLTTVTISAALSACATPTTYPPIKIYKATTMKVPDKYVTHGDLLTKWGTPDFTYIGKNHAKSYHYCGENQECFAFLRELKSQYHIPEREKGSHFHPPRSGMIVFFGIGPARNQSQTLVPWRKFKVDPEKVY